MFRARTSEKAPSTRLDGEGNRRAGSKDPALQTTALTLLLLDYFEFALELLRQALAVLSTLLVVPHPLYLSFAEGVEPPRDLFHAQLFVVGDGEAPVYGRRDAVGALLRLARGLPSIVERHVSERFGLCPKKRWCA